jgi:hypothetical protein
MVVVHPVLWLLIILADKLSAVDGSEEFVAPLGDIVRGLAQQELD